MVPLIDEKRPQLAAICRQYGVRKLDLFGSAAMDDGYDPDRSDLDFVVEFEPNRSLGPWLKHYFDFRAELERLFHCPVDVVMASALKHPRFVREVERTRRPLYAG